MKRLILLFGLGTIGLSQIVGAQSILSSVTHSGNASAGTNSRHYVWTRGGGPRTGHYWYWALHSDQTTNSSVPTPLNGTSGVQTSTGTFYAPTYSATSSSTNTFSNTSTQSVFSVSLNDGTTLSTPALDHQTESVGAQTTDAFVFTLTQDSDLRLDITMSNGGSLRFYSDNGEVSFAASNSASFHDTVPAGTYTLQGYLTLNASQNTQTGLFSNLGDSNSSLNYKLTVSTSSDNGGDGRHYPKPVPPVLGTD